MNPDAVGPDEDNLNGEWVDVLNDTTMPLDLSGWALCDAVLDCFTFPEGTRIPPGASIRIHSGAGTDTLLALYMDRTEPLWDDHADLVTLTDEEGRIVARCRYERGRKRCR